MNSLLLDDVAAQAPRPVRVVKRRGPDAPSLAAQAAERRRVSGIDPTLRRHLQRGA